MKDTTWKIKDFKKDYEQTSVLEKFFLANKSSK